MTRMADGRARAARTVLITGGCGGIGQALVETFTALGDDVWFTYVSESENPESVTRRYPDNPPRGVHLDLRDEASISELATKVPDTLDVLIHNAALGTATAAQLSPSSHVQDQALFQVNAIGILWLNELFVPRMVARGSGKIILFSSVGGGITHFPGFRYADGMSKAAVALLGKMLAADLANTGVDVITICPGATRTPMFEASTLKDFDPKQRAAFIGALPKGRLIEPEELSELVSFLCSDHARILHGAVIDASMGLGVSPQMMPSHSAISTGDGTP